MLAHKIEIVERSIRVNGPYSDDPVELLAKLGGFDIAAMCGMFLGGMEAGIPVVIDGYISAVSALLAAKIEPEVKGYMLPSHMSGEPSSVYIFEALGMKPVINASMRLGEGTGGVCLLPLLNIALAEYGRAHRFGDREVEQYTEY
jgi:nicotinate-nucleotide--dimethylbenzimidazole phosphoribosyltransferase